MSEHLTLQEAIRSFLESGGTMQEIRDIMAETTRQNQKAGSGDMLNHEPTGIVGSVSVYESVPPYLMTISEASEEHGISRQAIYQWIQSGRISEAGILRGGYGNGLNMTLINRVEFNRLAYGTRDLPIYNELPDGLITVPEASRKYRRSKATLRRWYNNGYIRLMGKLRGPGPGGGSLLVPIDEVESCIANPPFRGGRRSVVSV